MGVVKYLFGQSPVQRNMEFLKRIAEDDAKPSYKRPNNFYSMAELETLSIPELKDEHRDITGKKVFLQAELARFMEYEAEIQAVVISKVEIDLKDVHIAADIVLKGKK